MRRTGCIVDGKGRGIVSWPRNPRLEERNPADSGLPTTIGIAPSFA